jgi:hypothetical protein
VAAYSTDKQRGPSSRKSRLESRTLALKEAREVMGGVETGEIIRIGYVACVSEQSEIGQHEANPGKIDPFIPHKVVTQRDKGEQMRYRGQESQFNDDLEVVDGDGAMLDHRRELDRQTSNQLCVAKGQKILRQHFEPEARRAPIWKIHVFFVRDGISSDMFSK